MGYLTEKTLGQTLDLPIALPATTIKQGDWVLVSTVKVVAPQKLTLRALTLHFLEATVDVSDVETANKIVPNLGIVYVVLRKDYSAGNPGGSGALDFLSLDALGSVNRSAVPVILTDPGSYSVICANNMQAVAGVTIPTSTSIDATVLLTGQLRLELTGA